MRGRAAHATTGKLPVLRDSFKTSTGDIEDLDAGLSVQQSAIANLCTKLLRLRRLGKLLGGVAISPQGHEGRLILLKEEEAASEALLAFQQRDEMLLAYMLELGPVGSADLHTPQPDDHYCTTWATPACSAGAGVSSGAGRE